MTYCRQLGVCVLSRSAKTGVHFYHGDSYLPARYLPSEQSRDLGNAT